MSSPAQIAVANARYPSGFATLDQLLDDKFGNVAGNMCWRGSTNWQPLQCPAFAITWSIAGNASIANDIAPWQVLCQNLTIISGFVCAKTAPTGTSQLSYDIKYNRAGGGFVSIFGPPGSFMQLLATVQTNVVSAASMTGYLSGGLTNGQLLVSDILRVDCTAVGGTIAGADATLQLICIPTPPA